MSWFEDFATLIKTRIQNHSITLSQIADGLITLAKLNTIGASAGQVPTFNGTNIVWDAPNGEQIGTLNSSFDRTAPLNNSTYPIAFINRVANLRKYYTTIGGSTLIHQASHSDFSMLSGFESSNFQRRIILFDGSFFYFISNSLMNIMGAQRTADFSTFSHFSNDFLNSFISSYTEGNVTNDYSTKNAFAICLVNNTNGEVGFVVNQNGVWSDFIKPPLVGGLYLQPRLPSMAGLVYQNGVLSAYFPYNQKRYWTEDYGVTWTECTNGFNDRPVHRMANGSLYSYSVTSMKFSTDNGKTWTTATTLPATPTTDKSNHCIDFNGTNYVFVAEGTNSVWTATSLTGTWTLRTSAFTTSNPKHVYWCNDIFLALSTAAQSNGIMSSTDGITWVQRNAPTTPVALRNACKCGSYYVVSGTGRTHFTANITSDFSQLVAGGIGGNENAYFVNIQTNRLVFGNESGAIYSFNGSTGILTTLAQNQQTAGYGVGISLPTNTKIRWRL